MDHHYTHQIENFYEWCFLLCMFVCLCVFLFDVNWFMYTREGSSLSKGFWSMVFFNLHVCMCVCLYVCMFVWLYVFLWRCKLLCTLRRWIITTCARKPFLDAFNFLRDGSSMKAVGKHPKNILLLLLHFCKTESFWSTWSRLSCK